MGQGGLRAGPAGRGAGEARAPQRERQTPPELRCAAREAGFGWGSCPPAADPGPARWPGARGGRRSRLLPYPPLPPAAGPRATRMGPGGAARRAPRGRPREPGRMLLAAALCAAALGWAAAARLLSGKAGGVGRRSLRLPGAAERGVAAAGLAARSGAVPWPAAGVPAPPAAPRLRRGGSAAGTAVAQQARVRAPRVPRAGILPFGLPGRSQPCPGGAAPACGGSTPAFPVAEGTRR